LVLAPSTPAAAAHNVLRMATSLATMQRAGPETSAARTSPGDPSPPTRAPRSQDAERHQAVVVGAGSAGLAAAVALQRRGFETIVIEQAGAVGASWRSRYPELRLNSWRPMSKLQGRGMPRTFGRYPSRDDVVAYLESFARRHGVTTRFRTQLVTAERDSDLWRLETSSGTILCRYLVIATGWDAVPDMPHWPGAELFTKELIHAADFAGAAAYAGRDVLVVGGGNSGFDIASHLAKAGARVTISVRTPPNIAEREVLGLPGQPILVYLADRIPSSVADALFHIVQRLTFGDLSRYGIPRPRMGVYANHRLHGRSPAIDDGFVSALKRGTARAVGPVEPFDGGDVVLVGGDRLQPHSVICATGYRRGPRQSSVTLACSAMTAYPSITLVPVITRELRGCTSAVCGHRSAARFDSVPFMHGGLPERQPSTGGCDTACTRRLS
jgi:NAD(P)H-hydrate repair Nnr-like enzyme with NAD(P)H-hydrate epimerase domain